jgi:hypothetical protein
MKPSDDGGPTWPMRSTSVVRIAIRSASSSALSPGSQYSVSQL